MFYVTIIAYFCAMLSSDHKNKKRLRLQRLSVLALLTAALYSCASIGHLEGGPYDEEPPRFVSSNPLPGSLNTKQKRISITFDEYIVLDKPGEKIVISPPQVQQPEIKASSKRVIVTLKDTLKSNTTYTIDFADAVQDNNEGNPLPGFTFTFSTGEQLDTMAVGGTVLNAADLEPVKGILVGLHANLEDSAFNKLPFDRVGRTDSRGRFSIRGVAPGKYRIYALQDADQNFAFTQPMEVIAFQDSLIIPSMEPAVRQDTFWIDSLTIDTIIPRDYTRFLPDDVLLRCFKEKTTPRQRLARSERLVPNKFSLYFTAPSDTLPRLEGLNFDENNAFIVECPTGRNDTLTYWIKDSLIYLKDTLAMRLDYYYTDTLDRLVPRTDTLKLVSKQKPKTDKEKIEEAKKKEKERKKREERGEKVGPDTEFLPVDVYAPSSLDVFDYLSLTFEEPVASIDTSMMRVMHKVDTLWVEIPCYLEQDTLDLKSYNIYTDEWIPGDSYCFEMDSTGIHGLYGLFTDKIRNEFTVKKLEEYGAIFFNITGAEDGDFVELLDGQDKVVRTVTVKGGSADFYFLPPSTYGARLVKDTNRNGVWDTGKYDTKLQPEEVFYYWQQLELKANFELTQTWILNDRPLDKQKPDDMKKQKPDEDKQKNRNRNNNRNY